MLVTNYFCETLNQSDNNSNNKNTTKINKWTNKQRHVIYTQHTDTQAYTHSVTYLLTHSRTRILLCVSVVLLSIISGDEDKDKRGGFHFRRVAPPTNWLFIRSKAQRWGHIQFQNSRSISNFCSLLMSNTKCGVQVANINSTNIAGIAKEAMTATDSNIQ